MTIIHLGSELWGVPDPAADFYTDFGEGVTPAKGTMSDPECEEEWRAAQIYCTQMMLQRKLGKRFSWIGRTLDECMRGQVSERCGGNRTDTPRPSNPRKPGRR
jgi:hypothetical protein